MEITILPKGGEINIKEKDPNVKNIFIGAGWDVNEEENGKSFDLDLTAALIGADGKGKKVVYYQNLKEQGVEHTGDNLTGAGEGDDEQVKVSLDNVSSDIEKILFIINIYDAKTKGQNFGMVKSSFVRIVNADTNQELARHDLQKEYDGKSGVAVAELSRTANEWVFKAIAEGADGSIQEILNARGL